MEKATAPAHRYETLKLDHVDALLNPIMTSLASHVSVRSFDANRPLPEETLEALAVAAQSAPTSSNLQSYSIIALTDPQHKAEVVDLCGNYPFFKDCPLFLVFCVDIRRLQYLSERQGRPFYANTLNTFITGAVDAALACENAAVAAESMGLGTCMCGDIRSNPLEVARVLRLPPGVFALVGLGVGYPTRKEPIKPRLPLSVMLHREYYSVPAQAEGIDAYDRTMAEFGAYGARRVPLPEVDPATDTGFYGWCEHTARRLAGLGAYYTRRDFREILARRGFNIE